MPTYFVAKAEFVTIISMVTLDYLTGADDTIIDEMVDEAVEEMKAYIGQRYDADGVFNVTGTDRSKTAMMLVKDMVLYNLYSRHRNKPMPEIVTKRFEKAMQWLRDLANEKFNKPNYTLLGTQIIRTGGNPKRENHQL